MSEEQKVGTAKECLDELLGVRPTPPDDNLTLKQLLIFIGIITLVCFIAALGLSRALLG
jgi:hypothetical protein